jgi:hypothetical protein
VNYQIGQTVLAKRSTNPYLEPGNEWDQGRIDAVMADEDGEPVYYVTFTNGIGGVLVKEDQLKPIDFWE